MIRATAQTNLALVMMIVTVLMLSVGCTGATSADRALPDIKLERLNGGAYDVTNDDGPRALNLWATWCAPCRAELPAFDAVADRLRADRLDVEVIGVNVGDSSERAAALVAELELDFDQVLDQRAQIQRALEITGLPATILVDESGAVIDVHNGELTEGELTDLLDETFDLGLDA